MKCKSILLTAVATLGLTAVAMAQNICQTIGTDSLSLYQNQYYTGPGLTGASCTVHTESKWINTIGSDSIYFKTIQHRLYDNSKIYDKNNNLIWSWNGENVNPITWYTKYHTLNISGNDSIRIEVYQGLDNFCATMLQLLKIYCSNSVIQCNGNLMISPQSNLLTIGSIAIFNASTSIPNPSYVWQSDFGQGFQTLNNFGNYSGTNSSTLNIANVKLANHTQQIRVISTSGNCIDTSNVAVIYILDTCITNVTVYDTLLTTVTDTLVINTLITGISPPNNLNTLKVFPNPAHTHITIDYGNFNGMSGYIMTIVNSNLQTVFTTAINQQTSYIDLSTWTGNGIYFVKLIDTQNNIIENRKIVIQ